MNLYVNVWRSGIFRLQLKRRFQIDAGLRNINRYFNIRWENKKYKVGKDKNARK